MVPFDLAHQIGLSTLSKEVLIVGQGVCRWRFKNRDLGNIFASILGTRRDTGKWMVPLDSAHRIRVSTLSREVLTVEERVCRWRFKNRELGYVFASALGTSRDTGTWRAPLDSAHRIGVSTLWTDVLTLD